MCRVWLEITCLNSVNLSAFSGRCAIVASPFLLLFNQSWHQLLSNCRNKFGCRWPFSCRFSNTMHCRPTSHNQMMHTFLVLLFTANQLGYGFAVDQRICKNSTDCPESQCCAETPIGNKMCIDYEKRGDICLYRTRTPTCGCAPGLKCVSTTPMEPGVWNHAYVCARVRPFQHYKLNPYLMDSNDVE